MVDNFPSSSAVKTPTGHYGFLSPRDDTSIKINGSTVDITSLSKIPLMANRMVAPTAGSPANPSPKGSSSPSAPVSSSPKIPQGSPSPSVPSKPDSPVKQSVTSSPSGTSSQKAPSPKVDIPLPPLPIPIPQQSSPVPSISRQEPIRLPDLPKMPINSNIQKSIRDEQQKLPPVTRQETRDHRNHRSPDSYTSRKSRHRSPSRDTYRSRYRSPPRHRSRSRDSRRSEYRSHSRDSYRSRDRSHSRESRVSYRSRYRSPPRHRSHSRDSYRSRYRSPPREHRRRSRTPERSHSRESYRSRYKSPSRDSYKSYDSQQPAPQLQSSQQFDIENDDPMTGIRFANIKQRKSETDEVFFVRKERQIRADFKAKFDVLYKEYPKMGIPIFNFKDDDLDVINEYYARTVRQIRADEVIFMGQFFTIAMFCAFEYAGTKMFGLDLSGFAINQISHMKRYNRLLYILGERSTTGFGEGYPIPVQMIGICLMNAVVFIFLKKVTNNLPGGLASSAQSFVFELMSGQKASLATDLGGLGGLGPDKDDGGGGGGGFDIGGIMGMISGFLGNMNKAPDPSARAGPAFDS